MSEDILHRCVGMKGSNRYELFYITAMEALENLITDTINKKETLKTPHDESYQKVYLTALKNVKLSFQRQANLFKIRIE